MFDLASFAKNYFKALNDIVCTLPKGTAVPPFLSSTSFVIACSDKTGKVSIELVSRDNFDRIILNGKEARPESKTEPGLLISQDVPSLIDFLFAQDDKRTSISVNIEAPYCVLEGFTFSNKEYNEKYWKNAKFDRNCSGTIPFMVGTNGSVSAIDILWGYEQGGYRQERLFSFLKLYGNHGLVPSTKRGIQDEAFRDFRLVTPDHEEVKSSWSFTDFLSGLESPVEKNVLLLGSYKSDNDFEKLKAELGYLGYNAFLLKDSPDLPIQSNIEKLVSAIICSCFVIVVDKEASGHIAELSHMLQFRWRPVIVIRENSKPTTAFLEDTLLTDSNFRVAILDEISKHTLIPYIKWAKELINRKVDSFNTINHWRN